MWEKRDGGPIGPTGPVCASGPRGERRESGASGVIYSYNYLPTSVLENFQIDSEGCCFIFRKGGDDVKKDKRGNITC